MNPARKILSIPNITWPVRRPLVTLPVELGEVDTRPETLLELVHFVAGIAVIEEALTIMYQDSMEASNSMAITICTVILAFNTRSKA